MTFRKGEVNYRRGQDDGEILDQEAPANDRPPPIVARFMLADVPGRGEWLLKRLAARWPHISEATFAGRVRAWIGSNSHHFIKGAHSVGLFRLIRSELDALPFVEEVFLFTRDPKKPDSDSERDAVALYREAARWARNLGATHVVVGKAADLVSERMVKLLDAAEDIEVMIVL